jgi:hypothetical protein
MRADRLRRVARPASAIAIREVESGAQKLFASPLQGLGKLGPALQGVGALAGLNLLEHRVIATVDRGRVRETVPDLP